MCSSINIYLSVHIYIYVYLKGYITHDVSIHMYIAQCLRQVKHICLLKHLSFPYGENFQHIFLQFL
jgi:hypothetical protein